jgi:hypothetical protein
VFILRHELIMFVMCIVALAVVSVLAGGIQNVVLPPLKWAWTVLGLDPAQFNQVLSVGS